MTKIKGYGDNLTVNNICIGNLSPSEHEKIELENDRFKPTQKPKIKIGNFHWWILPPLCSPLHFIYEC